MCSCAFRYGSPQYLATQGYSTVIPSSSFISSPTYSDFMFYKCINKDKVFKALDTVRYQNSTLGKSVITDADFKKLAELADSGNDVKIFGVNIKRLLGSIQFDQSELDNAQCKIAFSNQ